MTISRLPLRTQAATGVLLLAAILPPGASALNSQSLVSRYRMTISECDSILTSEISQDFGPPLTPDESAALWIAASEWRWNDASEDAEAHPFVVCESTPGLSGWSRRKKLEEVTGGFISTEDDSITSVINTNDKSCYVISADANFLEGVLDDLPVEYESIQVQPLLPGLKMTGGTVDAVDRWIEKAKGGDDTGPAPSVVVSAMNSAEVTHFSSGTGDRSENDMLGLAVSACPAAKGEPVEDLAAGLVSFLTDYGGEAATKSSFDYDAPARSDVKSSARNEFWSMRMKGALSSNNGQQCLSTLRNMVFDGSDLDLGSLRVILPAWRDMGESWEDCLWYALRGLALHRSVCSLEKPGEVTTFNPEDVVVIGAGTSGNGQTGGGEEADTSDSKGAKGDSIQNGVDSGASADFRLPGVRSVTIVLAACWVMLL